MCGNGIRCLAQFLKDIGEDKGTYKINTLAGNIVPVMNDDGTITVDMGPPELVASKVPTTLAPNFEGDSVVEQDLECNGKNWKVNCVSTGNPHCIIFVDDLEKDIDFESDGPALESYTDAFPAKIKLKIKVRERGAGPTLACGTGACAPVVAAIRANQIPRGITRATLSGGDLFVEWKEDNKVYMTGPATFAFEGVAHI